MKTIAIVTPKIDTFSNPTLTLLIEKLIERGYKILFLGYEQIFTSSEIMGKINFYSLPFNFYKFKKNPNSLIKLLKQYFDLYKLLKIENKVSLIICIDPFGLVIAGRIKKIIDVKLIYISFEIFFEDEFFVQRKKILKRLEMEYSQKVDLVVIQDERREKLLKNVNNFNERTKFMKIPVSPKPIDLSSNTYNIYKELNIPEGKKIVVYSGTLQNWCGINEILNLFPEKWNPDFWFVIHSHHKIIENTEIKIKMDNFKKKKYNISYHNEPFYDYAEYTKFLSKCHIGIATYFPNNIDIFAGKNIQEIGLASGKFSTYMMIGLPTITTANSMYPELNLKYCFGETIQNVSEIPEALIKILNDYENKILGCKALYENVLNPVSGINSLMDYIEVDK
ncbi:MAG: hypothetical protein M3R36_08075 [Bacteroidota bacterium]|nr:hypothetical protein [Bacteroidota bacterium]